MAERLMSFSCCRFALAGHLYLLQPFISINRNACVGQTSIQACVPELAGYKGRISAQSYRPSQRRQRASDCASFTTNTFLLVQLYASGWKVRALTGQAVTQGALLHDGRPPDSQPGLSLQRGYAVEVTVTQRPVFLIMCHRTGNFQA